MKNKDNLEIKLISGFDCGSADLIDNHNPEIKYFKHGPNPVRIATENDYNLFIRKSLGMPSQLVEKGKIFTSLVSIDNYMNSIRTFHSLLQILYLSIDNPDIVNGAFNTLQNCLQNKGHLETLRKNPNFAIYEDVAIKPLEEIDANKYKKLHEF